MTSTPGEEQPKRAQGEIVADIERYRRLLAEVEAELKAQYGDPDHDR